MKHVFDDLSGSSDMPACKGPLAAVPNRSREDGIRFDGELDGFRLAVGVSVHGNRHCVVQGRLGHAGGEQVQCTEHVFVGLPDKDSISVWTCRFTG
jgi:hypothetical protein